MDGVILAGGLASRLGPITKVTNKHLLPIYNKPLIFYGIETLRDLGCERIIIVLGGNSVGDIVNLVRDGSSFGVEIIYKYQNEPKGISHAIGLVEDIILNEESQQVKKFLVLLGDNIFSNSGSLKGFIKNWLVSKNEAIIFMAQSDTPHEYGQPVLTNDGTRVVKFVEKDSTVDHDFIVTGLYGLDDMVFERIRYQKPSNRGELEITDTLTALLPFVVAYNYEGFWSDCGTPEGLIYASQYFAERGQNESSTEREKSAAGMP